MKKNLFVIAIAALVCILFTGIASAEHGYARVSDIPMAVDFAYSVEFADDGTPYFQTDYPFEETGAMQMILTYTPDKLTYCLDIIYDAATQQASFNHLEFPVQDSKHAAQMIHDGELKLRYIYIGTVNSGPDNDWWLEYSVPRRKYDSYVETTSCPSFFESYNASVRSSIYYNADGVMTRSYMKKLSKSQNYGELHMFFDAYGKLTKDTYIMPVGVYDPETGLFDGRKIDELGLGFEEADLLVPAPAALDPVEIASAEYGYTRVSEIPMAVDFTYSVEIEEDGTPCLQTDYPFEETGAMQMILMYIKEPQPFPLEIFYDPATKQSTFGTIPRSWFPGLDKEQAFQEAVRMIREGEITPDYIMIGTVHGGPEPDWWLEYSVPGQQYVTYTEKTFSPSYNEISSEGKQSIIGYTDGIMIGSYIRKVSPAPNYGELRLCYDVYGKLSRDTYIWKTSPAFETFHYDPETGLFDGKKIDELGLDFEEADLLAPAPAALDPVE